LLGALVMQWLAIDFVMILVGITRISVAVSVHVVLLVLGRLSQLEGFHPISPTFPSVIKLHFVVESALP
jgi:hypothetical protein